MLMGWEGFSSTVDLVLASFAAIAPFWLFSTVSLAGFTCTGVISIVAILVVGFEGFAPLPPKLICLKNQLPGLLEGASLLAEDVGAIGKGGRPLLLGGVFPLLAAGESLGVEYTDLCW
jgi:hypothetical protein